MHQRTSKKIIIYFLLFISLCTVSNIELNNKNFFKIKKINIFGINNIEVSNVKNEINNLNINNIISLNKNEISNVIDSYSIVENYKIFKKYPSTLNIEIIKTNFLAKINYDGKTYIVGSNGRLINEKFNNDHLPYIFGNPETKEFLKLKEKIDLSKFSYDQIKNFYFYPSKRWDLELKDGIRIKLPNFNIVKSLNQSFEFLNHKNLRDIKIIDLRVKNQIIIK
tara:strand:+ start:480 stop:1148 length:669 start_codon:yes stop_codon:yes gene_type:complete